MLTRPFHRPRRLRGSAALRDLVRETRLAPGQLIYPVFVQEGKKVRQPIPSMPGQFRYSVDALVEELGAAQQDGVVAAILFGIPESAQKDARASQAYAADSIVCRALEAVRRSLPELILMADVCLCEYTDHGHCGRVVERPGGEVVIDNDSSLELLAEAALTYTRAGAHVVAPSDMMDGRVRAIREALDGEGLTEVPILSYAAKYASAFYGPFRDAAESAPRFGDRRSYQMDPGNAREALREIRLDLEEGADMVMVKPAMPYLDVIAAARRSVEVPLAAYQVSGEYAALCAAFANGWLARGATIRESLLGIRRAGADLILTYFAREAARSMRSGEWG